MNVSKELKELSKDNLLDYTTPNEIYQYYLNNKLQYNKAFSSPFRVDKNPSFVINDTQFKYRDFATGEYGDCFNFVMTLYNINFYEALKQISYDLGLYKEFYIPDKSFKSTKKVKAENYSNRKSLQGNFELEVKIRSFEKYDIEYWNLYGISLKYLKLGNIYAISHYFINKKAYKAEKFAYVYVEKKDNKITLKIYQPLSSLKKWINGNNYSVWELWNLLPETNDNLIITSSRKDALSIIENMKIPATSFQAESINPKPHIVKAIFKRFPRIYLLYDNDYSKNTNWGQKSAERMIEQYPFINLIIPEKFKSKDFSDLVSNYGRAIASNILKEVIDEAGNYN